MGDVLLQAHRGVSTDYPENTVSSVLGAAKQGYPIIEIDPAMTRDGQIILMHDRTINRTGRNPDGSRMEADISVSDITYEELLQYDFGIWFSDRFQGERAPLLSEILEIAKEHDLLVKIDNKFESFSRDAIEQLYSLVNSINCKVAFTVNSLDFAAEAAKKAPHAEIHYDGAVSEDVVHQLCALIPRDRLTVWLPYPTKHNTWVRIPFADEKLAGLVKQHARLGLWILSERSEYNDAVARFAPDIIETTGKLKPARPKGFIADMHTHSKHSHDSVCPIKDMAEAQLRAGVAMFAVTDHCDIEHFETRDLDRIIGDSVSDAEKSEREIDGVEILCGVEIGEGFWHKEVTERIIAANSYDVIIGSVHAVKFTDYEMPYSTIDFAEMGRELAGKYLDGYLDDVLKMTDSHELDILAHLTCPLRYMNGKYGLGIDCRQYREKIEKILKRIIEREIALEINTSCRGSAYNEFMPEEWIVALYRELGGSLVTLGSDAHMASNASHSFDDAIKMLKSNGFEQAYYYKKRQGYGYKI